MKRFTFSFFRAGLWACFFLAGIGIGPEIARSRPPEETRRQESTRILFRVMSYNVENFFDTAPHPFYDDKEFLPDGNRHWTPKRYHHKLQQIAKVITAAGEWDTPALVGLCEIENDSVLTHLLRRTPLRQQNYRFCIARSADRRGIRVALLYQRDKFACLGQQSMPIRFSGTHHKQTRHILHVWGRVVTGDTLDVCVCHFPSRYGGEKESERDRFDAARTLRGICDSLAEIRQHPYLLLMGDFNDTPENRSMTDELRARPYPIRSTFSTLPDTTSHSLYNLFADLSSPTPEGTHKYQGEWNLLDQMIVNAPLLSPSSPICLQPRSIRLFAPPFLFTKDKTWRGRRPFRTYYGFKYEGGFSDHLPILADFTVSVSSTGF